MATLNVYSGPILIKKDGSYIGAMSHTEVIRALAQQEARRIADGITPLTNSAGGTAGTIAPHAAFANVAASGSNLADATTTDAALDTIHDALGELYAKANAFATALGITGVTNSGGGTTPDGTLGAITVSVTGAATGAQAASMNTTCNALDRSMYNAAILINKLSVACGYKPLAMANFDTQVLATIPAITIAVGSAASPGVTKAAVDAALVTYRAGIKALGDRLVAMSGTGLPLVIAVD